MQNNGGLAHELSVGVRVLPRTCIGAINGILASFCSGPENLSEVDFLVIRNYNLKLQAKIKSFSLRLFSVRVLMTAT